MNWIAGFQQQIVTCIKTTPRGLSAYTRMFRNYSLLVSDVASVIRLHRTLPGNNPGEESASKNLIPIPGAAEVNRIFRGKLNPYDVFAPHACLARFLRKGVRERHISHTTVTLQSYISLRIHCRSLSGHQKWTCRINGPTKHKWLKLGDARNPLVQYHLMDVPPAFLRHRRIGPHTNPFINQKFHSTREKKGQGH